MSFFGGLGNKILFRVYLSYRSNMEDTERFEIYLALGVSFGGYILALLSYYVHSDATLFMMIALFSIPGIFTSFLMMVGCYFENKHVNKNEKH